MGYMSYSETVAAAVSSAIDRAGMSRRGAAIASGIPPTTLERRFTAPERYPFTVSELEGLAAALGVDAHSFTSPVAPAGPGVLLVAAASSPADPARAVA
jgi:hypothetical protein